MPKIEILYSDPGGELFTASSFLAYMRRSAPHWWGEEKNANNCPWVFRGHRDAANWKLVPFAARSTYPRGHAFPKVMSALRETFSENENWDSLSEVTKDQVVRNWAYSLSVQQFAELANNLSFDVDMPRFIESSPSEWIETAFEHPQSLNRRVSDVAYRSGFDNTQRVVSLAQHHGIPTFLLDWTQSTLTACHFAASTSGSDDENETELAVWALNLSALEKLEPENRGGEKTYLDVLRPTKSGNNFLAAQSGLFTCFRGPEGMWSERGAYPELDNFIENHLPDGSVYLRKVVLSADQLPELRTMLLREGVSQAHMMPTLDNVRKTALATLVDSVGG